MFDTMFSPPPSPFDSELPKPCKPDYETLVAKKTKELGIIKKFISSLTDFIDIVGPQSFNQQTFSLSQIIGNVDVEIIRREKELKNLHEQIEGRE